MQPSAFSLGDICVPPMANVLKVFLENGQTKSFKYDASTTVEDVVSSLKDKLCLTASEHFSLVLEHVKTLRRNKLTLLDPEESLARVRHIFFIKVVIRAYSYTLKLSIKQSKEGRLNTEIDRIRERSTRHHDTLTDYPNLILLDLVWECGQTL